MNHGGTHLSLDILYLHHIFIHQSPQRISPENTPYEAILCGPEPSPELPDCVPRHPESGPCSGVSSGKAQ